MMRFHDQIEIIFSHQRATDGIADELANLAAAFRVTGNVHVADTLDDLSRRLGKASREIGAAAARASREFGQEVESRLGSVVKLVLSQSGIEEREQ